MAAFSGDYKNLIENDKLVDVKEIFDAVSKGRGHYSGKIAFDKNGFLYVDEIVLVRGLTFGGAASITVPAGAPSIPSRMRWA